MMYIKNEKCIKFKLHEAAHDLCPRLVVAQSSLPTIFTMFATLIKLAALGSVTGVWSHAVMEEPAPRQAGPAHQELCGAAVAEVLADGMTTTYLRYTWNLVADDRNRPNRSYRECHKGCGRRLQLRRVFLSRLPVRGQHRQCQVGQSRRCPRLPHRYGRVA